MTRTRTGGAVVILLLCIGLQAFADVVKNCDFESVDLSGWQVENDGLTIETATNTTFNREYSAWMHGSHSGVAGVTNRLSQTIEAADGDSISVFGGVYVEQMDSTGDASTAEVRVRLEGLSQVAETNWTGEMSGWQFFTLKGKSFGFQNGGFEYGSTEGWMGEGGAVAISMTRSNVLEGEYAVRMQGSWTNWNFCHLYQDVYCEAGDTLDFRGWMRADQLEVHGDEADFLVAGIKIEGHGLELLEDVLTANTNKVEWRQLQLVVKVPSNGTYSCRAMIAGSCQGSTGDVDIVFDNLSVSCNTRVRNGDFEQGVLGDWICNGSAIERSVSTNNPYAGDYSLRYYHPLLQGGSFANAQQKFLLRSGDVVRVSSKVYLEEMSSAGPWVAAGIKIEWLNGSGSVMEQSLNQSDAKQVWHDLAFTYTVTNEGEYAFWSMVVVPDEGTNTQIDVYFDDLSLVRNDERTNDTQTMTLNLEYAGSTATVNDTNTVSVYFDSVVLEGSSALAEPSEKVFSDLAAVAQAIASDPTEDDVPEVLYPKLNAYGYPKGVTNQVVFPSHTEWTISGWRFRFLTNDIVLMVTNRIECQEIASGDGVSTLGLDYIRYCGKFWHNERGGPITVDNTNTYYFTIGTENNSNAEFGDGPFPLEHTYTVGEDLTNFPKCLTTSFDESADPWPRILYIRFPENFSEGSYDRSWDKYFIIQKTITNAVDDPGQKIKMVYACNDAGNTNLVHTSSEIFMGAATQDESAGMVDYPNCVYQGHNEVFQRVGWLYGLLDRNGWFVNPVPRGSATIEPVELYTWKANNWIKKIYEEYLFTWPSAFCGVRSIYDDDFTDKLAGQISYHVGFKIGHKNGTNEFGEAEYPQVAEMRGNGYLRMTDYDGVMGGSFRPVAADIFGLYAGKEDAPLTPAAYMRLIPRTTETNGIDDSYLQLYMPVQSKTNDQFIGVLQMNAHCSPEEVRDTGMYFDMKNDVYLNRALYETNGGSMTVFAQVDMYWRGGDGSVGNADKAHDFDVVMLHKTDGEWISHHPINPPTNIYRRTLGHLQDGDSVYIMQQDRVADSHAFKTEAPYDRVSTFRIDMLDDGGRDVTLDMFEQNTISEANDNCVITGAIHGDMEKGERVETHYLYRSIFSPGVIITAPNTPDGGNNWSGKVYNITFYASDADSEPLYVNIYYGTGKDDEWTKITSNEVLTAAANATQMTYAWNTEGVAPGAYYVKVEAEKQDADDNRIGFDVSDYRLQVGDFGVWNNGQAEVQIVTNAYRLLGVNMDFETSGFSGWAVGPDQLDLHSVTDNPYGGNESARYVGSWSGWNFSDLAQDIPVISGEQLHVTAKVYIDSFEKGTTEWVAFKVEMKNESVPGDPGVSFELNETSPKDTWLTVDFTRTAPADGFDVLHLMVMGNYGQNVDIYVDDIQVTSTNGVTVVTNGVRSGYWEETTPIDFSGDEALAFNMSSKNPSNTVSIWVTDSSQVTNVVSLNGTYVDRIRTTPQRVTVPWSAFASVDKTQIQSIGFDSIDGTNFQVRAMQSLTSPVLIKTTVSASSMTDGDGLSHFNPGDVVTQIVEIVNNSGSALENMTVQLLQEYAVEMYWWDGVVKDHMVGVWSEATRTGDRLCGSPQRVITNVTISAAATYTVTNVYTMPYGRFIDNMFFAMKSDSSWYVDRNYATDARIHVVLRSADGAGLYDSAMTGLYSMDDDFDLDNDGLLDSYEMLYSGTYTDMKPNVDDDSDGISNYDEFISGSDPSNPDSYFSVDKSEPDENGRMGVAIPTVAGRWYSIYATHSLETPAWQVLSTNKLDGTGSVIQVIDEDSQDMTNRYYKVGVDFSEHSWPL